MRAGRCPTFWGLGERLTWVVGARARALGLHGLVLGPGEGVDVSVIGWHTGILGKLVFFIGLAVLALVVAPRDGHHAAGGRARRASS